MERLAAKTRDIDEQFLPERPPAWVADSAAPSCQAVDDARGTACGRAFDGFLEWRHHCRFCGRVVCSKCSQQRALLPEQRAPASLQRRREAARPRRAALLTCGAPDA